GSKEFQKLSLTDVPPQPQVPKSGKPLEQKPAPEWMRHEKPNSASTYSPSNPPDWTHELDCKPPEDVEEYVCMKRSMLASVMSKLK
nr:hypothetical protein [Tanacetum cinerariifolium]